MNKQTRSGFTLPEVLLATALSVMVFFALGTLLTRSFSVWYNGMAQWKLAQHARVTRIRLLDGGFGKGTGLLSSKEHEILPSDTWTILKYTPVLSGSAFEIHGWSSDSSSEDMRLKDASGQWAYGQSVKNYGGEAPDVKINEFDATLVNANTMEITYMLRFSAAGRNFEQPQTIRAIMLNTD